MRQLFIATCLAGVVAKAAFAQVGGASVGASSPLAIGETFVIQSPTMGEPRRINVYLPPIYMDSPTVRLPVLYMPDGGIAEDFLHVAGLVQVSFDPKWTPADVIDRAGKLGLETVITVEGEVAARPAELKNAEMETGEVEVRAGDGGAGVGASAGAEVVVYCHSGAREGREASRRGAAAQAPQPRSAPGGPAEEPDSASPPAADDTPIPG